MQYIVGFVVDGHIIIICNVHDILHSNALVHMLTCHMHKQVKIIATLALPFIYIIYS